MSVKRQLLAGLTMTEFAILFGGCVTINVYFPAAAAEKAADKIIDEVYRIDAGKGATGDKPATK
jgi:hypothetical protein